MYVKSDKTHQTMILLVCLASVKYADGIKAVTDFQTGQPPSPLL